MPEMIDRIEALGKLQNMYIQIECACGDGNLVAKGVRKAYKAIERMPTIEAEPVRHGRWIVRGQDIYCSECNEEGLYNPFGASKFSHFCPNCGADMRDGGADNG